jgi:FKBP-type peptidyl-prolyl cis-trans isomerase FklB
MKKMMFLAAAVAAMMVTSCQKNVQADLKEDVDSLTYELGVGQADGLKQYMTMQLGVDSTQIDEFIRGMQEGALNDQDAKQNAYLKGLEVGKQVQQMIKGLTSEVYGNDSTKTLNINNLLAGLTDGLKGKATMTSEEALKKFEERLKPLKEKSMEAQYGDNKKAGEDFLAANAKLAKKKKKSGIVVLPSGLQYKVLVAGNGPVAKATDKVKVKYEGRLIDGTVFDSTEKHGGEPATFSPGQVIKGWTEALTMMPVGSKWQLYIPQELAYGSRDTGQIKPFSTLIFDVEVLEIVEDKKDAKKDDKKK